MPRQEYRGKCVTLYLETELREYLEAIAAERGESVSLVSALLIKYGIQSAFRDRVLFDPALAHYIEHGDPLKRDSNEQD